MNYEFNEDKAEIIYRLCMAFNRTLTNGKSIKGNIATRNTKKAEFDYIPSSSEYIKNFLTLLEAHKFSKKTNILDLGCGISPILSYLHFEGYKNLHGVDNEKNYVRGMNEMLWQQGNNRAIEGNLLALDKPVTNKITKADVIYLYQPIVNSDTYKKMIRSVFKHMKKGAFIVDFYGPIIDALLNVRGRKTCKGPSAGGSGKYKYYKYSYYQKTK